MTLNTMVGCFPGSFLFMPVSYLPSPTHGARIGCPITQSGEERGAVTRRLGAFRTSMLQDVEAGKPDELVALVTVVREIGERVGVPTPHIDTLPGWRRCTRACVGYIPAEGRVRDALLARDAGEHWLFLALLS